MDNPSAKEESTEIVIQNDGATRRKKPVQEGNADNYANNINELKEDLDKTKAENKASVEKLREAEEKAQRAKNEVKNMAIKFTIRNF
jgi:outer membrane murein-binding lipoprotein Lpp